MGGVGGSGFDKWARFTQFGVRFMVKAAFHGHGCRMAPMTSRVCRAGAPFGTSWYFVPGVVPYIKNGVFPLCLLLYNNYSAIIPTSYFQSQNAYFPNCLLHNYHSLVICTCSEGLSVHSVRYRPHHLLQGARTCRSRR